MSRHTPGPWTRSRLGTGEGQQIQGDWSKDSESSAQVCAIVHNEADAHLIAAAPDLLEALKLAESELDDYVNTDENGVRKYGYETEELKKIRRAIAKAEGKE